jgi:hypothetical protein
MLREKHLHPVQQNMKLCPFFLFLATYAYLELDSESGFDEIKPLPFTLLKISDSVYVYRGPYKMHKKAKIIKKLKSQTEAFFAAIA